MSDDVKGGAVSADEEEGGTRRDFLYLTAGAMGVIGTAAVVWPFFNSLNPAQDALALATVEVDLGPVEVGQSITVQWRGKPVFIRHRTAEEISEARSVDVADLKDPQTDTSRVVVSPELEAAAKAGSTAAEPTSDFLVVIGVCTHLGCIPLGQKPGSERGDFGGWFCPCHGSHYDTSGRIRLGPAPTNLAVPEYNYLTDTRIQIG
ncbi:MAG: ubiquinol-cytochrome c reductase iron-sulfur subunit [Rhodospirillales bacterium]